MLLNRPLSVFSISIGILLGGLVVPGVVDPVAAAPEVKSATQSQVAVDGSVDTFTFANGASLDENVEIVLSGPDGASMTFIRASATGGNEGAAQVWRLDGTKVSGPSGWTHVGSLDGVPADGTWRWSIIETMGLYSSRDDGSLGGQRPDINLFVAGKTIRAGFNSFSPGFNNPQFWNWHITPAAGTFQDDRPSDGTIQEPAVQADENLDSARFYQPEPTTEPSFAPETKPKSESEVAVDGSTDTFTFASGSTFILTNGVEIVLAAPDGSRMSFTRAATSGGNEAPPQVWRLDGTKVSGPAGWVAVGNLDGVPADGTWQWTVLDGGATVFYDSYDLDTFTGGRPDITLAVSGKTIRAGFVGTFPAYNNPQSWNWHVTPAASTFQDDRPDPFILSASHDEWIQGDENLGNARFYEPDSPPVAPETKSRDESHVAVDGTLDTFAFGTGHSMTTANGVEILLTAPDGSTLSFTRASTSENFAPPPQVWRLDGTKVSGPAGWTSRGNLDGVPADGTWTWTVITGAGTFFYNSHDLDLDGGPDVTLSVSGKTIRAGYNGAQPTYNNPQTWNWHVTPPGGTFQDDRPAGAIFDVADRDPSMQADEDLNGAVFYRPEPPAAPDPKVQDNPDGTCTLYNDADHDGVVDSGEALQTLTCPNPKTRNNPDGSITVYDDKDDDGVVDPGETLLTTPVSPDQDGDGVPDSLEDDLCAQENPNFNFEGTCVGSDYSPPTAAGIVEDVEKFLP